MPGKSRFVVRPSRIRRRSSRDQLQIHGARFDGLERGAAGAAAGVELAHRQDEELLARLERALAHRIELANRLDDVAGQLDTQRLRMRRREDVEEAAADGEVAAVLHQRHAAVAPIVQLDRQASRSTSSPSTR